MMAQEPLATCTSCGRRRPEEDLVWTDAGLLCQPCLDESVKAEERRDSIDAAWKSVEASVPKGWTLGSLLVTYARHAAPNHYSAAATMLDERTYFDRPEAATGDTAAKALRALAAKLAAPDRP
jgi:hypothetical protein